MDVVEDRMDRLVDAAPIFGAVVVFVFVHAAAAWVAYVVSDELDAVYPWFVAAGVLALVWGVLGWLLLPAVRRGGE